MREHSMKSDRRGRRAKVSIAALLLPFSLLASACGSNDDEGDSTISIAIPQDPQATYGIFELGVKAGVFKDHGLDVETVGMQSPNVPAALVSGEIDFSGMFTTVATAGVRGLPVSGVYVLNRSSGLVLLTSASIKSVDQLDGTKVVTAAATSGPGTAAKKLVEDLGLDIKLVPVSDAGSRLGILTEGQAAGVVMDMDAAFRAINNNPDLHILIDHEDFPSAGSSGLGVSRDYLSDSPDSVEDMIKALNDVVQFIADNPDESKKYIADILDLNPEQSAEVYEWYRGLIPGGVPDQEYLTSAAEMMSRSMGEPVSLDSLNENGVDFSIAESAEQAE